MTKERKAKLTKVANNRQKDICLVLEDIHDPHNVGAILRTAEFFGIQQVILVFKNQTPFDPKKIGKSSSSTANKWLSYKTFTSQKKALCYLKQNSYTVVSTVISKDSKSIYKTNFKNKKLALVVGNEHSGISDFFIKNSDLLVVIPKFGIVQSLNVSVASAIFLYEVTRQRVSNNINNYKISSKQSKKLLSKFLSK